VKLISKFATAGIVVLFVGCAGPNPYGNSTENYGESEANQTLRVTNGTIIDLTPVTIDSEGNLIGKGAGALIGGLGASTIGSGTGSDVAAVAGAVIGGIIGNKAEEAYNKANGVQITVELPNGRVQAIVQEVNENVHFRRGDHVRIVRTSSGKSRVMQ
jgi:outer membrane lipoprotein SlyB